MPTHSPDYTPAPDPYSSARCPECKLHLRIQHGQHPAFPESRAGCWWCPCGEDWPDDLAK